MSYEGKGQLFPTFTKSAADNFLWKNPYAWKYWLKELERNGTHFVGRFEIKMFQYEFHSNGLNLFDTVHNLYNFPIIIQNWRKLLESIDSFFIITFSKTWLQFVIIYCICINLLWYKNPTFVQQFFPKIRRGISKMSINPFLHYRGRRFRTSDI